MYDYSLLGLDHFSASATFMSSGVAATAGWSCLGQPQTAQTNAVIDPRREALSLPPGGSPMMDEVTLNEYLFPRPGALLAHPKHPSSKEAQGRNELASLVKQKQDQWERWIMEGEQGKTMRDGEECDAHVTIWDPPSSKEATSSGEASGSKVSGALPSASLRKHRSLTSRPLCLDKGCFQCFQPIFAQQLEDRDQQQRLVASAQSEYRHSPCGNLF